MGEGQDQIDDLTATDGRFFTALLAADAGALEEVLAPDFLIVDVAAGGVTDRADFLAAVQAGAVRFDAIRSFPAEAVIRTYAGTAIIVGRTAMSFTLPDGTAVNAASRYTHVFVRADTGAWQLASAQGTAIS